MIADVVLVIIGLLLFATGIDQRHWSRTLYGILMILAPVGYRASKEKEKRIFTSFVSLAMAMTFAGLSVVNHNPLWLIAAALGMFAAAGFYLDTRSYRN